MIPDDVMGDTKHRQPTYVELLHQDPATWPTVRGNSPVLVGDVVSFHTAESGEWERLGVVIDANCKLHGYDLAAYAFEALHQTQPLYWNTIVRRAKYDGVGAAVNWEQAATMFRAARAQFYTGPENPWYNPFTATPPPGVKVVQQFEHARKLYTKYFGGQFPRRLDRVLLDHLYMIDVQHWNYDQVARLLASRFKIDERITRFWLYDWTDSVDLFHPQPYNGGA